MLHEEHRVDMIRRARAGWVSPLTAEALPDPASLAEALRSFIEHPVFDAEAVDQSGLEAYSARESTRALAAALDLACERQS